MLKNYFNKINVKAYLYHAFFETLAVVLSEIGIGCYYTASVGADPISVFVEGVSFHCSLTVGEISTVCNIVLSVLMILFLRDQFDLGTFIQVLIAGPSIDFFYGLLMKYFPPETTAMPIRIVIFIFGLVIFALGLALSIRASLGVGPFSFPPLIMAKITPISLKYTQIITDACFFITGAILGGVVGLGTVASVLLTGPLMDFFMSKFEPYIASVGEPYKK